MSKLCSPSSIKQAEIYSRVGHIITISTHKNIRNFLPVEIGTFQHFCKWFSGRAKMIQEHGEGKVRQFQSWNFF